MAIATFAAALAGAVFATATPEGGANAAPAATGAVLGVETTARAAPRAVPESRQKARRQAPATVTPRTVLALAESPQRARLGVRVRARRIPVLDVVGRNVFWVGRNRAERVLVHLQGRGTRWAIRKGQRLTFKGVVSANRKGSTLAWGLTPREGGRQYKRQGRHLEVYGPSIRFGCVRPCA